MCSSSNNSIMFMSSFVLPSVYIYIFTTTTTTKRNVQKINKLVFFFCQRFYIVIIRRIFFLKRYPITRSKIIFLVPKYFNSRQLIKRLKKKKLKIKNGEIFFSFRSFNINAVVVFRLIGF